MIVYRKAYVRSDGTKVKATTYRTSTSGRGRGDKTPTAKFSKRKGYSPWITREGKLGGPGFLSRSQSDQHKILDQCVRNYGYKSCLGSVMVLNRARTIREHHGPKLLSLKNYLVRKYGGSTKSRSSRRSSRRSRY